ncbi:hypothetical protein [Frankia sp. Cj3]|uniref:hypothetical protein n=1 Tax=Frankia sp. Cj3 TaxID=2880976 RepID=UPI001EF4DEFD|nr:hypothetical protein [Frankia sp. Cj3]
MAHQPAGDQEQVAAETGGVRAAGVLVVAGDGLQQRGNPAGEDRRPHPGVPEQRCDSQRQRAVSAGGGPVVDSYRKIL